MALVIKTSFAHTPRPPRAFGSGAAPVPPTDRAGVPVWHGWGPVSGRPAAGQVAGQARGAAGGEGRGGGERTSGGGRRQQEPRAAPSGERSAATGPAVPTPSGARCVAVWSRASPAAHGWWKKARGGSSPVAKPRRFGESTALAMGCGCFLVGWGVAGGECQRPRALLPPLRAHPHRGQSGHVGFPDAISSAIQLLPARFSHCLTPV